MLSPRWQHAPLSGDGAARAGGRWNPRGVSALYLSANHGTAIAEYMQGLIHPGTLAPFDVESAAILDLTNVAIRTSLAVDDALLHLPWRHARDIARSIPDSWAFADAAIAAGFDGLRVPSVMQRGGVNLVLWRWGETGARVTLVDPHGELAQSGI